MDSLAELRRILSGGENISIAKIGDDLIISYSSMYETPEIGLKEGNALQAFFGSKDVRLDFGEIRYSGCETCDFGSDYGHEIRIVAPTQNLEVVNWRFKGRKYSNDHKWTRV